MIVACQLAPTASSPLSLLRILPLLRSRQGVSSLSFRFLPAFSCQPSAVDSLSLSPLFATLTSHSHIIENTATLSLVSATLTSRINTNPFVCHSYRKHPGGWHCRRGRVCSMFPVRRRQDHQPLSDPCVITSLLRRRFIPRAARIVELCGISSPVRTRTPA